MNIRILGAALVASTIYINADAQTTDKSNPQATGMVSASALNAHHTVLGGNWSISFDGAGNLHISDQNRNVVRIVEGVGLAAQNGNGSIFNSPSTYPFTLSVDKEGDLHIVDKSVYSASDKAIVKVLPHEADGFSDPDMPQAATTKPQPFASLKK